MRDLFICPVCNNTTPFEGAPANERVVARTIVCTCGQRYVIVVNYGCRVLDFIVSPKQN
jgi:transcription elongation factor Elf1